MAVLFERKEIAGAMLIALGLVLGGAITVGAHHFGLSTPGLFFEEPGAAQVKTAPCAEESVDESGNGDPGANKSSASREPIAGRRGRLAPVDINTATSWELEAIDGIGPALAGRIVELRKKRGGSFQSYEELLSVKGIGPTTLERIRSSSTLGEPEGAQKNALRKSTSTQPDSSGLHR
jgi:competence protein ComEA